jgi:hypothetical protein
MKYLTKTGLLAATVLIAALPILVAVHLVSAAGTATLSLTPTGGSLAPGDNLVIDVYEDSGADNVNAVQANLTYSSNLLSFSSADSNGSAFTINAQNSGGGGTIQIGRGTTTPVSGRQFVSRLTFHATTGGTASVNFGSGSVVIRSSDNVAEMLNTTNGSYTISTPVSTGAITLSPATKTVTSGTSFDVQVYENSNGDGVNGVQANLSYNTSLLTFISSSGNTSAWPIEAQNSASGGVVFIGRGTCGGCAPLTGTQLVATITFKAANPGTATVNIAAGSGIVLASDNSAMPANNKGGAYTIASASGSGSSGGGSSSGSGATKKSSAAPIPPQSYTSSAGPQTAPQTTSADATGPVISDIKVTNLTTKSATITWKTSEPATSEVDYGLSTKFILNAGNVELSQNHSVALDPKQLAAHKTFHFVVKSSDASGNQSASDDMTFSTGSTLNAPKVAAISAGAVVVAAGIWAVATGFGGFTGLGGAAGSASGTPGGGSYTAPKPLIVSGGAPPPPPPSPVVQPPAPASQKPTTIIKGEEPQTPGEVITPKAPPK